MMQSRLLSRSLRRARNVKAGSLFPLQPCVAPHSSIFEEGRNDITTPTTTFQVTIHRNYQTHASAQFLSPGESVGSGANKAQYMRMEKFVQDLHPYSTSLPNPNLVRDAIFFFQSQSANLYALKNNTPDDPKEYLKRLIHFLDYQYDNNEKARGSWIRNCTESSDGHSLMLTMMFFLRLFGGTARAIRTSGTRTRRRKDVLPEEALEALEYASKVFKLITKTSKNKKNPSRDPMVRRASLTLWKDRCGYFANLNFSKVPLSPEVLQETFGGAHSSEDCINEMDRILRGMDRKVDLDEREAAYSIYVAALSKSGIQGAAHRAMQVLQEFEARQKATNTSIYSAVMQTFANEAKFDWSMVNGASKLWEHVCSLDHLTPSDATFGSLLLAYSNAEMPEEAERVLMQQELNAKKLRLQTTTTEYNVVVNAWAKSESPGAAKKALALLRSMIERSEREARPDVAPDVITYTAIIDAFARNPATGEEGLKLAEDLLRHCESEKDPNVRVDHTMYLTYMRALARRLRRQNQDFAKINTVERMESLLFKMKSVSSQVHPSMSLHWHNAEIYGHVIEAWTRTRSKNGPKRALRLYSILKEEAIKSGNDESLIPHVMIYHDLLTCMGLKAGRVGGDPGFAEHVVSMANSLLQDMQALGYPLTIKTLNLYLRVMSTRRVLEAVQEAERQLQALEDDYAKGIPNVVPDSVSYQVVMEGYAKFGLAERTENLLNQMISLADKYTERRAMLLQSSPCYTAACVAWGRSGREDAVKNIERLLQYAEKRGLHPTTHMYTTLINAFAHSESIVDGPERGKQILAKMKSDFESGKNPECEPAIATFAAYLKCWEMSGRGDAPDQIEAIVMHLHELQSHDQFRNLAPTHACFRVAFSAWEDNASNRADAGKRAVKLLSLADEYCQTGKIENHQLRHCYFLVLATLAQSQDKDKAVEAYNLLQKLRNTIDPRAEEFEHVLRACRETGTMVGVTDEQKQKAMRIASSTFREFRESGLQPTEGVYKEMLDLHRTLVDGEHLLDREKLVEDIFMNAPPAIQNSENIRLALKQVLSSSTYQRLVSQQNRAPRIP